MTVFLVRYAGKHYVRGAMQYAFIATPCPSPGGSRDEAGAPTTALLQIRTPFTNSATLSDPLLGAWFQSITIILDFRYQDDFKMFKDHGPSKRGTSNEISIH